jgi:hypothetical protein
MVPDIRFSRFARSYFSEAPARKVALTSSRCRRPDTIAENLLQPGNGAAVFSPE